MKGACLGGDLDRVPNPIGFCAPFFLHSHLLELQPRRLPVAGALSESPEHGGRGQESRGRDRDPLTTQAMANSPTCVSRGAVARLLVAACATSPSRERRRCHFCFFQGNLVLQRGGRARGLSLGGIPLMSPCWSGAGSQNLCVLALAGTFGVTPSSVCPQPSVLPWVSYWGPHQPLKKSCPALPLE